MSSNRFIFDFYTCLLIHKRNTLSDHDVWATDLFQSIAKTFISKLAAPSNGFFYFARTQECVCISHGKALLNIDTGIVVVYGIIFGSRSECDKQWYVRYA